VSDGDDSIDEFYDFWFDQAFASYNVFLIDRSNIPCLVPGWESFKKRLPSQLWRMETTDNLEGMQITPSNCCSIDFNLRLKNILIPPSDYSLTGVDFGAMDSAVKNPTATTPIP
jgi:hypothetical protein